MSGVATETIQMDLGDATVTIEIEGDEERVDQLYGQFVRSITKGTGHAAAQSLKEMLWGITDG